MDEEAEVLTIDAAAEYLGVSKMTLYRRIKAGEIVPLPTNPAYKRRERIRFLKEDVDRLKGQAQA